MKHPHSASVILLGFAALVAASSRDGSALFLSCFGFVLTALIGAPSHFHLLLRRSRWLLLTMLVMFGWLTPGTPLAGLPGASQEGLLLTAENIARLLLALSIVALILGQLAPPALVAGIRLLLAPLVVLNVSRDRIAVRLALTLNEVETGFGWREVSTVTVSGNAAANIAAKSEGDSVDRIANTLTLPAPSFNATDSLFFCLAGALLLVAFLT